MVEKGVDKNGKVEKNGIDSLMKTLHDFLKNIISVNQEDLDILIDIGKSYFNKYLEVCK